MLYGEVTQGQPNYKIEALNLGKAKGEFSCLKLSGEKVGLVNPMVFADMDALWFLGGRPKKIKDKTQSAIYKIMITWDKGSPVSAEIKQVKKPNGEPVTIRGHPTFSPNIPNKKYVPELRTWLFLDDQGGQHSFNPVTFETTFRDIQTLNF